MYQENPEPPLEMIVTQKDMVSSPPPAPKVKCDCTASPPYNEPSVDIHVVRLMAGSVVVLGPTPQHMNCPYCRADIVTQVNTEPNTKTFLTALVMCLCGWCLCSWIPCCVDSCQSQVHRCPNCKTIIGSYN